MKSFECRKTTFEIDAQNTINYINMTLMLGISLLITIWLSEDIIIKTMRWKIIITIGLIVVFMTINKRLHETLTIIKLNIELLSKE